MKRKLKVILSFIVLAMLILLVIYGVFNKKHKNISEENTIELESNTIQDNVIDTLVKNDIEPNSIDDSNTVVEETIKPVETTTPVENKKTDEKPKTSNIQTNVSSSETKTQTTNENTQTKDETNNNKIVKPTTNENTSTNNNNDNAAKKTEPEETKQEQTIKQISQEEYNAEVQKYLRDIQSIKPGLKYKNVKRGQVFWPYRTSEIEIAVGGVSFGTVYYYVEIFVEGNQEKFKYYIDWDGNE